MRRMGRTIPSLGRSAGHGAIIVAFEVFYISDNVCFGRGTASADV